MKNTGNIGYTRRRKTQDKWKIQRNWQHRVYETKKNKPNTQHNICWTPLYSPPTNNWR